MVKQHLQNLLQKPFKQQHRKKIRLHRIFKQFQPQWQHFSKQHPETCDNRQGHKHYPKITRRSNNQKIIQREQRSYSNLIPRIFHEISTSILDRMNRMNSHLTDYKVLTWNCREIHSKKEKLTKHALSFNIISCTQTWLKPNINFSIPGFDLIRKDRPYKK